MSALEKDDIPMLSNTDPPLLDQGFDSEFPSYSLLTRSSSIPIPTTSSIEMYGYETNLVSHTGPLRSERRSSLRNPADNNQTKTADTFASFKVNDQSGWPIDNYGGGRNDHLIRSGKLGICNDPFCITCPTYNSKASQPKSSRISGLFDHTFHNDFYGDAKGWAGRFLSFLLPYIPGVMYPHEKRVQQWNKFFVISCLVAVFLDPLFFFLLSVHEKNKCIVIDWPMTTTLVVFRSMTDFIYFLHMLLQFRLAYVAPESRVVGAGELVDHPKKIALHYLQGYFFIDFLVVFPLPQIIVAILLPHSLGSSGANYAKDLLRAAVLVQYVPRLYRFLPLLAGQTPNGFVFETAWANFVINLFTFILAGHVVGSLWYLFGLQRVTRCFRDACGTFEPDICLKYLDCGQGDDFRGHDGVGRKTWTENINVTACFTAEGFKYGIYLPAVNLTTEKSIITRYIYSLFWGFQQISTLAGNQIPSYYIWEVLFTMGIIGLGLLLFALLIGNMQNFLQALGRRRLEMSLRRRDVEQWMRHRRLPENLRKKVRQAERYNWASTRGVNEEKILENLPEDLQRNIRRHLFKFIEKVHIFSLMDYEPILDAIRERLRQKTYIEGSEVFTSGDVIEKMVFIVRGKMESCVDRIVVPLSEGDVCGEELLTWCLEHSSVNKDVKRPQVSGQRLVSNRTVRCLSNVEAFSLRAADLEEVTSMYSRFLRNPRVQGAIRYESPYWRYLATTRIQVAWRYRKKRLSRAEASRSNN